MYLQLVILSSKCYGQKTLNQLSSDMRSRSILSPTFYLEKYFYTRTDVIVQRTRKELTKQF